MRSDLQSTLGLCQEYDTVCILRTRSLPLIERIFVRLTCGSTGPKLRRSKGGSSLDAKFPFDHFSPSASSMLNLVVAELAKSCGG